MADTLLVQADAELRKFEPTRVITVRMSATFHRQLVEHAHAAHTSMNKLCLERLLTGHDDALAAVIQQYRQAAAAEPPPDLVRT